MSHLEPLPWLARLLTRKEPTDPGPDKTKRQATLGLVKALQLHHSPLIDQRSPVLTLESHLNISLQVSGSSILLGLAQQSTSPDAT